MKLPGRNLAPLLIPDADVEDGESSREASGAAGSKLWLRAESFAPGYHLLRLWVRGPNRRGRATLYFLGGEENEEHYAGALTTKGDRTVHRIVYLPRRASGLMLSLGGGAERCDVELLRLLRVPEAFAREKMLRRIKKFHRSLKGAKRRAIREFVGQLTEERSLSPIEALLDVYEQTFPADQDTEFRYHHWIERFERPLPMGSEGRGLEENPSNAGRSWPSFSVLVPTFNTSCEHLRACLDSVVEQSYPNWQLCIADDASMEPHVGEILREYAEKDERIQVVFRERNGHICAASNSALELASGDYCVLLDHDDVLSMHALWRVARAIASNPQACLFYSDEDKLSPHGQRKEPHFKPRYNPDLLLSQNYIAHLLVAKTKDIRGVGGFRPGFEGSQDHDLVLRLVERLAPGQIEHIPHVLYHWRQSEGSTAAAPSAKDYTSSAGQRAVQDALDRRGSRATVEPAPRVPNGYRVSYQIDDDLPAVSLIIPTRDGLELLKNCVGTILERTDYRDYELVIVDNGSVLPETLGYFAQIQSTSDRVRVIRDERPFNFSALNNLGVRKTTGAVLGFVNNDIEVTDGGWMREMVAHAIRPEVGCVGAKLLYPDGTLQHAGVVTGIGGVGGHSHKRLPNDHPGYFGRPHLTHAVSAVTAACLFVRREVYEKVDGFDEELPVAFNDVDFCLKVGAVGLRNIYTPYAELIHHESATRGSDMAPERIERFKREVAFMRARWGERLDSDPYYSPHLTRVREDFSIRAPNE